MIRPAMLVLGAAFALTGCNQTVAPSSPPYIRGTVTRVDNQRILVEADPTKTIFDGSGTRKSSVRWDADTRFMTRTGAHFAPDGLRLGQVVSVWIAGVVLDSYPDQVGATDIIVESQ